MIVAKAIDHVCLWVRSLPEAKRYYENIFGFECRPREDDEDTLVVESENIHLFLSVCKDANEFLSKQHISFEVESLDDVMKTLQEMGVTDYKTGEARFFVHRNYRWCEWRDPSGIRLECIERI
jgi:catechol 2,3-dioxygenase-like lactoylglutathione lyase family enzyme